MKFITDFLARSTEIEFLKLHSLSKKFKKNEFTAALHQDNIHKNRYSNILAPDDSRIYLGNKSSDYINANLLSLDKNVNYIVGQYPKTVTVWDFWQMVHEQNIQLILSLSPLMEKGERKGDLYWPTQTEIPLCSNDDSNCVKRVELVNSLIKMNGALVQRTFLLEVNGKSTSVAQLEFLGWGDFSTISAQAMLSLVDEFDALQNLIGGQHNCYLHCSAGVGRSGVFVVIHACIELLRDPQFIAHHKTDDDLVQSTLLRFRSQRPGLVQTPEQLRLIYESLLLWWERSQQTGLPRSH